MKQNLLHFYFFIGWLVRPGIVTICTLWQRRTHGIKQLFLWTVIACQNYQRCLFRMYACDSFLSDGFILRALQVSLIYGHALRYCIWRLCRLLFKLPLRSRREDSQIVSTLCDKSIPHEMRHKRALQLTTGLFESHLPKKWWVKESRSGSVHTSRSRHG